MISTVRVAISVLVWGFVSTITLLLMLPIYIIRTLTLCIHGKPGDELAHPIDALFLTESSRTVGIYWTVEVDGRIRLEELQKHLTEKFRGQSQSLHKFSSIPVCKHGAALWRKDTNFNINNHVKEHPTKANDEQHLKEIEQEYIQQAYTGQSMTTSGKMSPWSIYLIPTREGSSVLLFMVGHCLTDGVGCMNLFNQLLTDSSGTIPQPKAWKKSTELLSRGWNCATNFLSFASAQDVSSSTYMQRMVETSDCTTLLEWSKPISLADINLVRKSLTGATVNDIMCGTISEALNSYMTVKNTPQINTDLKVDVLTSVRPNQEDYTPQNLIGLLRVNVPPNHLQSVEDRIKHFTDSLKERKLVEPSLSYLFFYASGYLTSASERLRNGLMKISRAASDMIMSNVAGPDSPVRMMGRDVKSIIFIPTARLNAGLSFGISSYDGDVRVSVLDCNNVVETGLLMSLTNQVFDRLLEAKKTVKNAN